MRRSTTGRTLALPLGALLAACSSATGDTAADPASSPTEAGEVDGEVVVFAAASLRDTFTELGERFEQQHPGVTVTFSFGASSTLAQQLVSGAPADVFAAASAATVESAAEVTGVPTLFAQNSLEIVVPAGNPAGITGLADLADPEHTIALCAEEVPCGAAAVKAFEAAGLTPAPDTWERDVTATLTKVVLGEVDAALVYRTEVISAGDAVEGIGLDGTTAVRTDYPITLLADAPNVDAARAFIELVLSAEGRAALTAAGFDRA